MKLACWPAKITSARPPQKILNLGPNTLVIKRGEYGAMLFRSDTLFMVPAICWRMSSIQPEPEIALQADSSDISPRAASTCATAPSTQTIFTER